MNRATLVLVTLAACGSPPSEPARKTAEPAATTTAPAAGSNALPPSPSGSPVPAVAARAIDEPPAAGARSFRHLLVGALMRAPIRLTWTEWTHDGHTRLRVACQEGGHAKLTGLGRPGLVGVALTGNENDARYWFPPVVVDYRQADATHDLVAVSPPPTQGGCSGIPTKLRLTCKPDRVTVLTVGAALIPGGTKPDDPSHRPPTWRPSTRKTVDAERCDATLPDSSPGSSFLADTVAEQPLVWVADHPIEWAFENSDVVVQQGAYRFMPAP